jgi:MYXO-CTERM domain-containing protein
VSAVKRLVLLAMVAACANEPVTAITVDGLSAQVKQQRYTLIRDTAAEMGLYNAALLAGIAISETGLAHCYAEATWACQGPASTSCGGGPIIAGSADGPCPMMQGGLGMFQFDAGTYTQTVAAYGPDILTVEGNSAQAVSFVVDKLVMDIGGVDNWLAATAWMNGVPLQAGDPAMEQWASEIACRYNGCCSTSTTCTTRAAGYRDNALVALGDMGAAFWHTADRCAALPADGVIDQRSECYIAGGDPRYWRREVAGYADTLDWTNTTDHAAAANFGQWIVKTGGAGRFHVDVNLDGGVFGGSTKAAYVIQHAGATDTVIVDQRAATGFVSLGDFDFAGTGDEHVFLGDNTGEAGSTNTKLAFDAIRVQSLDGGSGSNGGGDPPGGCGGCSTGGAVGGLAGLMIVLVGAGRRRRRAA